MKAVKAYNTRYEVKYHVFAIILALCRPIQSTNPIRQLYSSGYSAYSCLIGLVDLIGRISAMNLAKALIVLKKKLIESSRTYAVKWQFLAEIPSDLFKDQFDTQEQSMLFISN
jgi:hypothetical protein